MSSDQEEVQSGWYGMLGVAMNTIHKIYIGELRGFDSETNDLFL